MPLRRVIAVAGCLALSACASIIGIVDVTEDGGPDATSGGGGDASRGDGSRTMSGETGAHKDGRAGSKDVTATPDGKRGDASGGDSDTGSGPPHDAGTLDAKHDACTFCKCASDAQFCADFDESDPLAALNVTSTGGTLEVVSTRYFSSPHSLSTTTSSSPTLTVGRTLETGNATQFDLRFEVYLDPSCMPSQTDDLIGTIQVNSSYTANVQLLNGQLNGTDASYIALGENNYNTIDDLEILPGVWTPVELLLQTSADGGGTKVATVGDASFSNPVSQGDNATPTGMTTIAVGQAAFGFVPCTLYFDNVTFNALP